MGGFMNNDKFSVHSVYNHNGMSYKDTMREILQSEVLINGVLKQNNINLKVVNSCQKDKRSI